MLDKQDQKTVYVCYTSSSKTYSVEFVVYVARKTCYEIQG